VNDSIALQKFQEWNDKIEKGIATKEDMAKALAETETGVAGWYLALPGWAAVGKRERQTVKRQFHVWKREQQAKKDQQQAARELQERQVQSYLQSTEATTARVQESVLSALEEGLRKKKQKLMDPPSAIWTLSGDASLAYDSAWVMTSQSNFCTVGILLQPTKNKLYFEVGLRSNGIVQVGWATPRFRPESSNGDGVGDCKNSWAYDPSRTIKLHKETVHEYGPDRHWKAGDTVGCLYDPSSGKITFSYNGVDLGVAFEVQERTLFPAVSCNPGEAVELRIYSDEMQFRPKEATPIEKVLATEDVTWLDDDADEGEGELDKEEEHESKLEDREVKPEETKPAPIVVEPLDLNQYESTEQLEELGIDRLKGALMAIGVKCGGTLHERAIRLFSLKGLAKEDYPPKLLAKKKTAP
jgi:hypothetical protein